jgi:hypothetical protein
MITCTTSWISERLIAFDGQSASSLNSDSYGHLDGHAEWQGNVLCGYQQRICMNRWLIEIMQSITVSVIYFFFRLARP